MIFPQKFIGFLINVLENYLGVFWDGSALNNLIKVHIAINVQDTYVFYPA